MHAVVDALPGAVPVATDHSNDVRKVGEWNGVPNRLEQLARVRDQLLARHAGTQPKEVAVVFLSDLGKALGAQRDEAMRFAGQAWGAHAVRARPVRDQLHAAFHELLHTRAQPELTLLPSMTSATAQPVWHAAVRALVSSDAARKRLLQA